MQFLETQGISSKGFIDGEFDNGSTIGKTIFLLVVVVTGDWQLLNLKEI